MNAVDQLILAAGFAVSIFIAVSLFFHLIAAQHIPREIFPNWRLISGLMTFFLAGYLLFLVIQVEQVEFPLEILTASVFLGGGLFVFLITGIALRALNKVATQKQELEEIDKELQQINYDLVQAYDSTIAGWAHALDLRDRITEGHSQRLSC